MENDVKVAENFEEAAVQAAEMIEAGKDVLIDMSNDGKFNVSEIVKPSWFATYGPVVGFGSACAVAGGLIGYGISKAVAKHKAKKEAAEIEKAFASLSANAFSISAASFFAKHKAKKEAAEIEKAFADKEAKQEETVEKVEGEVVNETEQAEEKAETKAEKKEETKKK